MQFIHFTLNSAKNVAFKCYWLFLIFVCISIYASNALAFQSSNIFHALMSYHENSLKHFNLSKLRPCSMLGWNNRESSYDALVRVERRGKEFQ